MRRREEKTPSKLTEVSFFIPLEKIVLETDSPYLIPDGVAGKRNTSKNLNVIVKN